MEGERSPERHLRLVTPNDDGTHVVRQTDEQASTTAAELALARERRSDESYLADQFLILADKLGDELLFSPHTAGLTLLQRSQLSHLVNRLVFSDACRILGIDPEVRHSKIEYGDSEQNDSMDDPTKS